MEDRNYTDLVKDVARIAKSLEELVHLKKLELKEANPNLKDSVLDVRRGQTK